MKQIFDELGRLIGYTIENGNTTTIYDNFGKMLGNYNAGTNYVTDNMGKIIGQGIELLGNLLKR